MPVNAIRFLNMDIITFKKDGRGKLAHKTYCNYFNPGIGLNLFKVFVIASQSTADCMLYKSAARNTDSLCDALN